MDDKPILRASVLARRRARPPDAREAAGALIARHGLAELHSAGPWRAGVVAGHAAVGDEPPTRALLEALAATGARVVLPTVTGHRLDWGDLDGWDDLVRSPLGLLEPARTTADAAAAAAEAAVVLVPALAVDRVGNRLGRGGGFYDRWLSQRAGGRVVAVVFDDEVVDAVPVEPHDRRVDAALTPSGLVALNQG